MRITHEIGVEAQPSNTAKWLPFFIGVGTPPTITGLLLVAASVLNWQNRYLPAFIHFPVPLGDVRVAIFNESISWLLASGLICLAILCIGCIAGLVVSRTAYCNTHRKLAAGIGVSSLSSLLIAWWMLTSI